ncbi:hypothetical protein D3C76_1520920 [compost metagenome]
MRKIKGRILCLEQPVSCTRHYVANGCIEYIHLSHRRAAGRVNICAAGIYSRCSFLSLIKQDILVIIFLQCVVLLLCCCRTVTKAAELVHQLHRFP